MFLTFGFTNISFSLKLLEHPVMLCFRRWREAPWMYHGELLCSPMEWWKATELSMSPPHQFMVSRIEGREKTVYNHYSDLFLVLGASVYYWIFIKSLHLTGVSKTVTVDIKGNWQRWLKVRDLMRGVIYRFKVQARTISYGPELEANITAGPVEGMRKYE